MLEESGYRVLSAANGSDALRLCTTNPEHIDLLLTDVVMPQMRGVEVARRVARIRPGLRVLFMSGYTDNSIDLDIAESVSFLQKPFTLDDAPRRSPVRVDAPNRHQAFPKTTWSRSATKSELVALRS